MNSYELSRDWFDWCFANPELSNPNHHAIYFFSIEHCNRLGWKDKFGFPSQMVMEAVGIKNWRTYSKTLNDLVEWGFIKMIEKSKNQYSANVIAIVKNTKAQSKALDKALQKHDTKHSQSIVSIDKQLNKEPNNNITTPKGDEIDFDILLNTINQIFGRKFELVNDAIKKKYKKLLKQGYSKLNIYQAMLTCQKDPYHIEQNYKYCTLEYFSRPNVIDMHGTLPTVINPAQFKGATSAETNDPNRD